MNTWTGKNMPIFFPANLRWISIQCKMSRAQNWWFSSFVPCARSTKKVGLISSFCACFFEQPIKLHKILERATFGTEWKSTFRRANVALAKLLHVLAPSTLRSVYHAIFNSHLNYGCQIWGQNQNSVTNRLSTLKKSAMRITSDIPRSTHSTPLFYNLGILKLFDQI